MTILNAGNRAIPVFGASLPTFCGRPSKENDQCEAEVTLRLCLRTLKHVGDLPPTTSRPRGLWGCRGRSGPGYRAALFLFHFALDRRRQWILDLQPIIYAARAVGRTKPFRHDSFTAEPTSVLE